MDCASLTTAWAVLLRMHLKARQIKHICEAQHHSAIYVGQHAYLYYVYTPALHSMRVRVRQIRSGSCANPAPRSIQDQTSWNQLAVSLLQGLHRGIERTVRCNVFFNWSKMLLLPQLFRRQLCIISALNP